MGVSKTEGDVGVALAGLGEAPGRSSEEIAVEASVKALAEAALAAVRSARAAFDDRRWAGKPPAARKKILVDIGQEKDEDGRPLDEENTLAKLSEAARSPAQQDNVVYLAQVGKFLATLSPADRETIRLVLIEGHTMESDDPDEVTAAKILGVGRRAINKRLAKVAAKLRTFQQES